MVQPNTSVTQMESLTTVNFSEKIADNATNNIPFLALLRQNGNYRPATGGTAITETILFAEATSGGWYTGSEVLNTADGGVSTRADFAWKQFYALITMNGLELTQNKGRAEKINLLKTKMEAAEAKLKNNIGASLFYANTENSGKAIGGLQHLIADDPTTGTVGGIDASVSTNSWWRNYVFDFSANSLTPSSSTILTALNTSMLNTNRNGDEVDLIVGGTTYFGYFEGSLQANQRFMDAKEGRVGFNAYRYKSATVMHDSNCSATRMYGINTKSMFFRPDPDRNFSEGNKVTPVNQDIFAKTMFFTGNLTCNRRKANFVVIA